MRSILINGEVSYNANAQILNSDTFKSIVSEIIEDSVEKNNSLVPLFSLFLKNTDSVDPTVRYDINAIIQLLLSLTINPIESVDGSPYYSFPKLGNKKELLLKFVETTFNYWRQKHRFILKNDKFTPDRFDRIFKQMVLVKTNSDLKSLVISMYRQILINISDTRLKILRQLPSGAQAGFLLDNPHVKDNVKLPSEWLYELNYVWSIFFEPPVIFYTKSNKRKGVFKVVYKPVLEKIKLDNPENWFAFPIHVSKKYILVIVHKELLCHASGLGNLFELTSFDTVENKKPDGIYIFGLDDKHFENPEEDSNGIIYKENDGTYVGLCGNHKSVDYFGYMKKMILTIHNLLVIDENRLPIHGALAEIKLLNGKKANVMIMGDSGAGKSETLDALNRLNEYVSEVNILIDDMGSLDIQEDGTIVAYGTETGAFVRLDDLQPGYAYSAMDRSIFMNPNEINARVIVPYSNYTEIIKPTPVDFFFYANNYEPVNGKSVEFFDNVDSAYEIFSKGARMAKGTTAEKGLTYSYFANPFGAVQTKDHHEKIARHYMEQMMNSGVKIGQIKTQLGIDGFEKDGPIIAAKALLDLIENS